MKASGLTLLDQATADEYADWFRCLSDGTRVRILNIVANSDHPMTVGEVVEMVGKSQSTVSEHLRILSEERYVLTRREGVRTLVEVNRACMVALPEAAAAIMATSAG